MRRARLEYQLKNPPKLQRIEYPTEPGVCVSRTYRIVGLGRFVEAVEGCSAVASENLVSFYRGDTLIGQIVWACGVIDRCEHRIFL